MEDINKIIQIRANAKLALENMGQQFMKEIHELFYGVSTHTVETGTEKSCVLEGATNSALTPQQTKKRIKRLSLVEEDTPDLSNRQSSSSNAENKLNNTSTLMPPPAIPDTDVQTTRPQRSAKLKSLKNLKEAPLGTKLRRPSKEAVKIKLEHEQRPSQIFANGDTIPNSQDPMESQTSMPSAALSESEELLPNKTASVTELPNQTVDEKQTINTKYVRIKIKREKTNSLGTAKEAESSNLTISSKQEKNFKNPTGAENNLTTTDANSTSTVNNTTTAKKVGRKKKDKVHKPIKVERFSEIENMSPISTRTRKGRVQEIATSNDAVAKEKKPERSTYENTVTDLPALSTNETVSRQLATTNEAMNVTKNDTFAIPLTDGMSKNNATITCAKNDATMVISKSNKDATMIIAHANDVCDATFNAEQVPEATKHTPDATSEVCSLSCASMVTAKSTASPQLPASCQSSVITEDEEENLPLSEIYNNKKPKELILPKPQMTSAKVLKVSSRTHELFNPHLESPVKMRVEAFENVAQAAADGQKQMRLRRAKENTTPGSSTTPVIGKLPAPTLGRFLTPTQSSSALLLNSAQPKKAPLSASKATTLLKSNTGASLKAQKGVSRENSGDDFRKGLHQLAEERKKQREQKHLLAAQQREAKERERAERMAKLAKEREEKRLKKLQEQKREIEEINRKTKQMEEAEAAKRAKGKALQDQERDHLFQVKPQQTANKQKLMMPPAPPKAQPQSKYTFEMLHEDDSTDDESKVSYKRPPPPGWSRSHVRGESILLQQYCPTDVIDSFFSVEPTTPDLKLIFPNIDPRHLKRNSSVFWNTPPRYSELPKY